jgi:hypothetical protein
VTGWDTWGVEASEPTPCPSCGRNTITVDGVCKECWAYKGDDGRPFRSRTVVPDTVGRDDPDALRRRAIGTLVGGGLFFSIEPVFQLFGARAWPSGEPWVSFAGLLLCVGYASWALWKAHRLDHPSAKSDT